MTSLARQLETLKVAASAQLGVERPHVSLLFNKKEAAALYKEDVLKIGRSGLAQLREIDHKIVLEEDEEELFADTALTLQRALLTKDENEKLDKTLEKVLIRISPYLLHFATQQILEWLIFRYQIHSFNGPKVFIIFLPFHNTKIYGRLLSILDLKGIEYDWVTEYGKAEAPIPFERLVTKCFSANHSLLSMICQNLENVIALIGEDYAERNLSHFFTLYAKLGVYLVHDPTKVNDTLISRMLPFLATSLRSRLTSLRLESLMITSQLCVSVTLTLSVLHSLLKMILLKVDASTVYSSINTVILICQRQNLQSLPLKGMKKLIRKADDLKIVPYIISLANKTDLTKFFLVLWNTLLPLFLDNALTEDGVFLEKMNNFLIRCSDGEILDTEMATTLFNLILENLASATKEKVYPESFCMHIRSLILRFAVEFDSVRTEWNVRNKNVFEALLTMCKINPYEMGDDCVKTVPEKKRRRRSSSCRKSVCEGEAADVQKPHMSKKKLAKLQMKAQIKSLRGPPREEFRGNPLEKLPTLIDKKEWEKAILALEKLSDESFLKRYEASDFEEFIAAIIKRVLADATRLKPNIRSALAKLPITSDFAHILLQRSSQEVAEKRARGRQAVYFPDESEDGYRNRLVFVLEVFIASNSVNTSQKLVSAGFSLLRDSMTYKEEEDRNENYLQRLIISLLVRMLENPVNYVVKREDIQMDYIVEIVRNTVDQRILRDCLRLLTAAVKISPIDVLSQIMSVFTFMGSGLLKKDNELTLAVIEEALGVLFAAVITDDDKLFNEQLVSVSRIFAASVTDIPAHRRLRILQAVANAATANHLWAVIAVLFEQYCVTWQRNSFNKGRTDIEQYEEMANEMVSLFNGAEQLLCVINLVEYLVYMGGDSIDNEGTKNKKVLANLYEKLFDRSKHSVQKLRHYRFAIIGWVARLLSSKDLFDKLSGINDEEMYNQLVVIGKRLLICSMELDDFVTAQNVEHEVDEGQKDVSTIKYWTAFTSRADIVAEKFRNLLPASVSGRLVADILADEDVSSKMRDRALQLLNVKLMQDGLFHRDGGIETKHMVQFAEKLIAWIKPAESKEEIILCQNAAFTLRLLARRLPSAGSTSILTKCINLCEEILQRWSSLDEALVGNVFLLIAEVFKSHNIRATLLASDAVVPICLDVINQQLENSLVSKVSENEEATGSQENESRSARRKRVAQQSMSGRRIGGDTLLVCGLTCLQRILDQFAHYVSAHFANILMTISRLSARYDPRFEIIGSNDKSSLNKTYPVHNRICQIRKAMTKVELRVILQPFEDSCQELIREPKPMVYLFSLYSSCLVNKDRVIMVKVLGAFRTFIFTAFRLRAMNPSAEVHEVKIDCETRMISLFLSVVEHLSENELRPILNKLYKWIEPVLEPGGKKKDRSFINTAFNIVNGFYDVYNTLALPHLGRFFELVPKILTTMNGRKTETESLLFVGKKGTVEALEGNTLITMIIDFVAKCAKHPEFFTDERAQLVLEPLVDELENTVIHGHEERCCPHLADCFYNIADTHNEIISDMFSKIMLKTRSVSVKVRYRTLLILEHIFSQMGEAVAPLLPSVLPFLSELLEDENKKVEEQCDKVLNIIRKNFGEEIADSYV